MTVYIEAAFHTNWTSDAQNLRFVYEWRQEQERGLRATKGTGMTEDQVNHFVDGCSYYPFPQLAWTQY